MRDNKHTVIYLSYLLIKKSINEIINVSIALQILYHHYHGIIISNHDGILLILRIILVYPNVKTLVSMRSHEVKIYKMFVSVHSKCRYAMLSYLNFLGT